MENAKEFKGIQDVIDESGKADAAGKRAAIGGIVARLRELGCPDSTLAPVEQWARDLK